MWTTTTVALARNVCAGLHTDIPRPCMPMTSTPCSPPVPVQAASMQEQLACSMHAALPHDLKHTIIA